MGAAGKSPQLVIVNGQKVLTLHDAAPSYFVRRGMLSGVSASKDLTCRRAEARAKHKSRSVLIVHVLSAGSLQHPSAVTNMHLAPCHWPAAQGPGRSRSRDHPSDVSTAKGGAADGGCSPPSPICGSRIRHGVRPRPTWETGWLSESCSFRPAMGICEAQGSLGLEGPGSKNRVASNGACITVERQASLTCEVGRTMATGGEERWDKQTRARTQTHATRGE